MGRIAHELKEDATEVIGINKLDFRIVEAGHEFPITMADEIVRQICEVWHI